MDILEIIKLMGRGGTPGMLPPEASGNAPVPPAGVWPGIRQFMEATGGSGTPGMLPPEASGNAPVPPAGVWTGIRQFMEATGGSGTPGMLPAIPRPLPDVDPAVSEQPPIPPPALPPQQPSPPPMEDPQLVAMRNLLGKVRGIRSDMASEMAANRAQRAANVDRAREAAIASAGTGRLSFGFDEAQDVPLDLIPQSIRQDRARQSGMNAFLESNDPHAARLRLALGIEEIGPPQTGGPMKSYVGGTEVTNEAGLEDKREAVKARLLAESKARIAARGAPDTSARDADMAQRKANVVANAQARAAARRSRMGEGAVGYGDDIVSLLQYGVPPEVAIAMLASQDRRSQLEATQGLAREELGIDRDRILAEVAMNRQRAEQAAAQGDRELAAQYAEIAARQKIAANELEANKWQFQSAESSEDRRHKERMKSASDDYEFKMATLGKATDQEKEELLTGAMSEAGDTGRRLVARRAFNKMPPQEQRDLLLNILSQHNNSVLEASPEFEKFGIGANEVSQILGESLPEAGMPSLLNPISFNESMTQERRLRSGKNKIPAFWSGPLGSPLYELYELLD